VFGISGCLLHTFHSLGDSQGQSRRFTAENLDALALCG
jgi:hypothetical protein